MAMSLQEYALFLKGYAHGVFDSNPYLSHATITAEHNWDICEKETGVKLKLQFRKPSRLAGDNTVTHWLMIPIKAIEDNQDKQLVLDWSQQISQHAWLQWEKELDQRAASEPMQRAIAAMQRPGVIRVGAHLDEV